jgi:hypothetical protein
MSRMNAKRKGAAILLVVICASIYHALVHWTKPELLEGYPGSRHRKNPAGFSLQDTEREAGVVALAREVALVTHATNHQHVDANATQMRQCSFHLVSLQRDRGGVRRRQSFAREQGVWQPDLLIAPPTRLSLLNEPVLGNEREHFCISSYAEGGRIANVPWRHLNIQPTFAMLSLERESGKRPDVGTSGVTRVALHAAWTRAPRAAAPPQGRAHCGWTRQARRSRCCTRLPCRARSRTACWRYTDRRQEGCAGMPSRLACWLVLASLWPCGSA